MPDGPAASLDLMRNVAEHSRQEHQLQDQAGCSEQSAERGRACYSQQVVEIYSGSFLGIVYCGRRQRSTSLVAGIFLCFTH